MCTGDRRPTPPRDAREFETPPLLTSESYFFVVRARDKAGLEDSNTVEKRAENLCV
jgi:hypothetical protein